jgi:hypothetical protein
MFAYIYKKGGAGGGGAKSYDSKKAEYSSLSLFHEKDNPHAHVGGGAGSKPQLHDHGWVRRTGRQLFPGSKLQNYDEGGLDR